MSDVQTDMERLLKALDQQHQAGCKTNDIEVLRTLSQEIRDSNLECHIGIRGDEIVSVRGRQTRQVGLAIDLGTTKIAGYLVDLTDAKIIATNGITNPQTSYGGDVIARLGAAMGDAGDAFRLRAMAVEAVNKLANQLCSDVDMSPKDIIEAVLVGNTAMHHLFIGLTVSQLARSPFLSTVSEALDIKARDLGVNIAPGAYVHFLPNIAGFVGGDHVAALLAIEHTVTDMPIIAVDIGTNTEISLLSQDGITTVSCASGPAFEGAHMRDGMQADSGAIERVKIRNGSIRCQTVDATSPIGICGSGILDAVSEFYIAGVIGEDGKVNNNHPSVREGKKYLEIVLVDKEERDGMRDIVITQNDIRELQLAKAAVRAGIQSLLDTSGCHEGDIKQVIIAGAFGSYIDVGSAVTIGMFPPLPLDRFRQVGNAAGTGAVMALSSMKERRKIQKLMSRTRYLELAGESSFTKSFIQASYLGQYRLVNGVREEFY